MSRRAIEDAVYDVEHAISELGYVLREMEQVSQPDLEYVMDAVEAQVKSAGEKIAKAVGVQFPNLWHADDHPVMAEFDNFVQNLTAAIKAEF